MDSKTTKRSINHLTIEISLKLFNHKLEVRQLWKRQKMVSVYDG